LQKLFFIGLGAMGNPMAACLIKAGFDVTVFDINPRRSYEFTEQHGARAASVLRDGCHDADVIIMILPNSRVVESVLFSEHGIAPCLRPGTTVIDMTSGVPSVTIDLCNRLAKQNVVLIDAPVSGAVARAESGDLTIMVGGSDQNVLPVLPVLSAMGQVARMGRIGSGDAMKALNNLVSCAGYLIGIEALLIGVRGGLSAEKMLEVLNSSTGMNNSTQKSLANMCCHASLIVASQSI